MKKHYFPLFDFYPVEELSFRFRSCSFSIDPFDYNFGRNSGLALSEVDRSIITSAGWALVVRSEDYIDENKAFCLDRVLNDANLLILTFRLMGLGISPSISYLVANYTEFEPVAMCLPIQKSGSDYCDGSGYGSAKLERIDNAYGIMQTAYSKRDFVRAHNAIYFSYLATHTSHWIQSFVFWMSALEALFSKDTPNGATKAISRRVSAYIGDPEVITENDIRGLYDIRSRIVHGDICASERPPEENLANLWKIEKIACMCFSKLIAQNDFEHYFDLDERNRFVARLD